MRIAAHELAGVNNPLNRLKLQRKRITQAETRSRAIKKQGYSWLATIEPMESGFSGLLSGVKR